MGLQMSVSRAAVRVRLGKIYTNQIELPVPHASLRDNFIGELTHLADRPLYDDRLNALLVVQVRVHGGDGQGCDAHVG